MVMHLHPDGWYGGSCYIEVDNYGRLFAASCSWYAHHILPRDAPPKNVSPRHPSLLPDEDARALLARGKI